MKNLKSFYEVKECGMCGAPRLSLQSYLHEEQMNDLTQQNLWDLGYECCSEALRQGKIQRHLRLECNCGWVACCLTYKDTNILLKSSSKYEISVKDEKVLLNLNDQSFILDVVFARSLAISILDHTSTNKGENNK